jgi:hypothetical protein
MDVYFLLVSDSMSINAKFPVLFIGCLRQVLVFNWNWNKPFDFQMKFHKLHKKFFSESCNTFSRSESGAETRSQTFQFLIDILNQNQVVEQVSTDI